MSDKVFPEPFKFKPERWLDKKELQKYQVTFGKGRRACLGKKMAELMAAWVMVVVMRWFDFQEVTKEDEKGGIVERVSQNSLTLPMLDGLPVRVKMRKEASNRRKARVVDDSVP